MDLPAGKLTAGNTAALAARFARAYHAMYGRTIPNLGVEIMSWSVTVATQLKPAARARHVRKRVAPRAATTRAVFEATHGTAPKYAGLDKINPGSVILSGVMMFEQMGWQEAADLIIRGMEKAIAAKTVTYDFERLMEGAKLLMAHDAGQFQSMGNKWFK